MSIQANTRPASYDDIIADPLFRRGYEEIWRGDENAIDRGWSDNEQLAYERGRQFGVYVQAEGEGRVPLSRGYFPHPRAKLLLMLAFRDGNLRP